MVQSTKATAPHLTAEQIQRYRHDGFLLRLWHDHVLIKQPHNNAPTYVHQDQPFWTHATIRHTLSAWIALVKVPVERGCMTFIPDAHSRTVLRPQNNNDEHDLISIRTELVWRERVTLQLQAGDCTFHHCLTPQMATPNNTDQARFAHVVIFMDADTTYSVKRRMVTDPLGLETGNMPNGPLFPRVGAS